MTTQTAGCPVATADEVLITRELHRRPSRHPDHAAENHALVALAGVMSRSPRDVLQTLADTALRLCRAGSAGVSVRESGSTEVFRWRATAGAYAPYLGGTMPGDFSPCGEVVARDATLLMADPARFYPYIADLCQPVREVLLVPFYQGGRAVGTVWVVTHTPDRQFDAEDARLVASLARFAGAAVQTLARVEAAERAERDREDIRARLEATLAAGEVGTWTWDVRDDRVVADRNLSALFGVSDGDARGGPIATYIRAVHPDDRGATEALIRRAVETGEPYEARYRVGTASGGYRFVVARGRPEFGADGAVARLPGVVLDVTREHQTEGQLRASEERRRLALDSAELGSWNIDPATNTLTSDERFQIIFAGGVGPITYEGAFALVHPDDRERVRAAVAASTHPGDPVPYAAEYRVVHPGGAVRWVFGKGRANFEDVGPGRRLVSFDGTVADITEQRRVNDALRQLAADLSEAGRRKDEFLATLAHELRNPLAPIRNGLTALRLGQGDADRERTLGMLERQLGQLVHLVDDLLDVARVTTGKVILRPERVAVWSVVEAAAETNRPLVEAGGHELSLRLPARPVFVDADPARLTQVLTNLLNNAAKYTPPGGKIELSVAQEGGEAVVRVTDTGIGIPPDLLPKVFDMFVQVGSSLDRAQGGLGLGLTLVRKLVEMHGGTVAVESAGEGRGSTFTVRLPVAADAGTASRPSGTTSPKVAPVAVRRVLVVDDNEDGADSLAMLLSLHGHEVRIAYTGPDALTAAREFRPEVALLDIGLPGLNGYEVAERLRADPDLGGCFLVALTGWGSGDDRRRAEQAGFDAHLTKPAEAGRVNELLAQLP